MLKSLCSLTSDEQFVHFVLKFELEIEAGILAYIFFSCFSLNFIYYAFCEILSKWTVGPAAIASIISLREISQLSQVIDSSFS